MKSNMILAKDKNGKRILATPDASECFYEPLSE